MTGPGNSRRIDRGAPDDRVVDVVRRHLRRRYDKPIQDHNRRAFAWLAARMGTGPSLVLDAGCGTGVSTLRLADQHPDMWVVGVDKSSDRLARGVDFDADQPGLARGRVLWIRADLVDLWRLIEAEGWRIQYHYLLYPNPWPKPGHLQRRWHAHPVFPTLVNIGRVLTLRTNWAPYATEFCTAMRVLGVEAASCSVPTDDLSPFELKYRASAHDLVEVTFDIDARLSQDAPHRRAQT